MTHRERDIFLAAAIRGRQRAQEQLYSWSCIVQELTLLENQLRGLAVEGDPAAAAAAASAEDLDLIQGWKPEAKAMATTALAGFSNDEILKEHEDLARAIETGANGTDHWERLVTNLEALSDEMKRRGLTPTNPW